MEMTPDGPLTTPATIDGRFLTHLAENVDELIESLRQKPEEWK
jgi:hypothetical protein